MDIDTNCRETTPSTDLGNGSSESKVVSLSLPS